MVNDALLDALLEALPESEFPAPAYWASTKAETTEPITPERIRRVDLLSVERGDNAEMDLCALVELTDDTWATCVAWCDTSGFGCQGEVNWRVSPSRNMAISQGLDRAARAKLGVALLGEF